jgi:hypothetical protein
MRPRDEFDPSPLLTGADHLVVGIAGGVSDDDVPRSTAAAPAETISMTGKSLMLAWQ